MFADLQNEYDWVLKPVIAYPSVDRLIEVLEDKIVEPAKAKLNQLSAERATSHREGLVAGATCSRHRLNLVA